jgi:hypothetical protein
MVSASSASRAQALLVMALFVTATLPRAASAQAPDPRDKAAMLDSPWIGTVTAGIERDEYHLSPSDAEPGYTAPNRAHDLRATWDAGTLTLRPRVDGGAWAFTYALAAVSRTSATGQDATPLDVTWESVEDGRLEWSRGDSVREWYRNDSRGIEQGFVLEQRPRGEGPVAVDGVVDGLLLFPTEDGQGVVVRSAAGRDVMRIASLVATDADGRDLPACFDVTPGMLSILVDDTSATYPITIDPLITSPAWTTESAQDGANHGVAVATAGDVNGDGFSDVIVGARRFDNGEQDEGRAFVYLGSPTGLSTTAQWTAEADQRNANFGISVSTAGDVNGDGFSDVIIGAYLYSNGEPGEGRAFVYHGSATGLAATPAWTGESDQASASYGGSVSTAGDVNGDGFSDVIVGALWYSNDQVAEGRAYAYYGSATGLRAAPSWITEGNVDQARYGVSVSTAGDVNGDGFSDVIVGANGYDNGQSNEGRAQVYHGSATGLSTTPAWSVESNQSSAFLGIAVGTAGDVNGDGYADVIVGAHGLNTVYAYYGSATGLDTTADWEVDGPGGFYGISVGTAGDVNGDGFADVIVGAFWYSNGEGQEGGAWAYQGGPTGLSTTAAWTTESNQGGADLGVSVATAGDVNGDGFSDVIVGAPLFDDTVSDEGAAFTFYGSPLGLESTAGWTSESGQANAAFGSVVAAAGDVNGDGFSDLLVGAPLFDAGQVDEGRVFEFHGTASGPAANASWTAEGNQAGAQFGAAIATAGDVDGDGYSDVIVGAPFFDNGEADEGRAFVFRGSASGLFAAAAWTAESDQVDASFGDSVATAGDVNGDGYSDIVVGASLYDNGQVDEGRASAYLGSTTGLAPTPAWTAEGDQAAAHFGASVGTAGDVNRDGYSDVIVGAPDYDNGQIDEGRAYAYHGSASGLSTTAAWTEELDQAGARFGAAVATAGDTNGDGYSDVAIGAPLYDAGQADEGRALVYRGSAAGLGAVATWTAESDQADARFGSSVATAGDVNGDGYSDLIVGAPRYDGGQVDEGRASVYHGSASGLSAVAAWTAESNQTGAQFGAGVATAGDANGDGYSDVLVGAPSFANGQVGEGGASLFFGNDGDGLDRIVRQRRFDGSAPIDLLGIVTTREGFLVTANGRSPFGRQKVRLEVEVEPLSRAFDGVGIQAGPFTDTGRPGASGSVVPLSLLQTPIATAGATHWRARLHGTAPYPWLSHWMGMPLNSLTETDLRAQPVLCDAGPPQDAGCPGNTVTLDGSASSGPRVVTYLWSSAAPQVSIATPTSAITDVTVTGAGTFNVDLTVTSGPDSVTCSTSVTAGDLVAPVPACTATINVVPTQPAAASVTVTASATDDCDPAVVITNDRTAGGADASDVYPCGDTLVTFTARDVAGNTASCTTLVTVGDVAPPAEVSATGAGVPLRVTKNTAAQEIHVAFEDHGAANELVSLYAGTIARPFAYDHAPVDCKVPGTPVGPGVVERIAPWDAGTNHYYLVSASNCAGEGTRGFRSDLVERPSRPTDCGALP